MPLEPEDELLPDLLLPEEEDDAGALRMVGIGVAGLINVLTNKPIVLIMAQIKSVMMENLHIVR